MNGLPYYKAYPRDFIEGTIGMAFELKGAYRLVLDLIYMQNGRLPDDARYISGQLGCTVRAWNGYREQLVKMGKLTVENGIISNFRASLELDNLAEISRKNAENGRLSHKNKGLGQAVAKRPVSHTEPDTEREETNVSSLPRKRASRLKPDWVLPRDWGEWALSEGWPDTVIRQEAARFKDYWIGKAGKDAAKLDWEATFRNWMRNCKSPKVHSGDGYVGTSKGTDRLRAFIGGAD